MKYDLQLRNKLEDFQLRLQNHGFSQIKLNIVSAGQTALRTRLDFTFFQGALGLYNHKRTEIEDINQCLVAEPELNHTLTQLKKAPWPFAKASLRLRIGAHPELKGIWIDAANIDIKKILEEKTLLEFLTAQGFQIEIGQKKKTPILQGNSWKLESATTQHWFKTSDGECEIPLHSYISSFTQPGFKSNKLLCDSILNYLQQNSCDEIIEFGAGIGNFSFLLAKKAKKLKIYEFDKSILTPLQKTLEENPEFAKKIEIFCGDFQANLKQKNISKTGELALVNPPRSGLKAFAEELLEHNNLRQIIYVSCFADSFFTDTKVLSRKFKLKDVTLVDQFPNTTHYEIVALFERL
ncbi:MAG: rRNA adenine N-6-methyltransferase family protein [Bdellovibrionia bacterium]